MRKKTDVAMQELIAWKTKSIKSDLNVRRD